MSGCQALLSPGSVFCKLHELEESQALLPLGVSKETLNKLNREQKKKASDLERDSIFVIEKILEKKVFNSVTKYHIKWENYSETSWDQECNISLVFQN